MLEKHMVEAAMYFISVIYLTIVSLLCLTMVLYTIGINAFFPEFIDV
jgi:hypothetical protein